MSTTAAAGGGTNSPNHPAGPWHNPYDDGNHKAQLAKINRERVQRRRTEWEFMKNIDKQFDIKNLDEARAHAAIAEEQAQQQAAAEGGEGLAALHARKIRGRRAGSGSPKANALPDILEFNFFLPVESMRCMAVAHGGASLWTGEIDGSINIRNGATGQAAFTIAAPPPAQGQQVTNEIVSTLYSPEEGTQMWVGTDTGTIRVYDSRIFVRLHEATHPTGPVSCFASSFNGRTFSAAGNSIIKWGTVEQKFAVLLEISHPTKVTSMKTHGFRLFVAGDCDIWSYNGETGRPEERSLETPANSPAAAAAAAGGGGDHHQLGTGAPIIFRGHTAPVTCLVVQAGLLLSGSLDGSVRAWEIETGEEVASLILPERAEALNDPNTSAADKELFAIVDIIADTVTGQLWSIDKRGSIDIWNASSTGRFSFVRHIQGRVPLSSASSAAAAAASEGNNEQQQSSENNNSAVSPVKQVTGAVAVDTSKIWSLGSNGINMIWHSTHNVMESQMAVAAVQMERELEEAFKEMAQWREFIRTRQVVYENLRRVLADKLATYNDKIVIQSYFTSLYRAAVLRKRKNRQEECVNHLEKSNENQHRWDIFQTWICHLRQKQAAKAKEQLVKTLRQAADQNRIVGEARQLLWTTHQMQHQRRLQHAVNQLARITEQNHLRAAFQRWAAFRAIKVAPYNKGDRSNYLANFANKQLMRQRYFTLLAYTFQKRRERLASERADCLARAEDNQARAKGFVALRIKAEKGIRRQFLLKQVDAMAARNLSPLLSEYYTLWYRWWAIHKEKQKRQAIDDSMEELLDLRAKFKNIEHLHRRRALLDHAEAQVEKARDALEATKKAQEDTRAEILALQQELEAKRLGERKERERSISEQVDDLIAMLKSKALNLHHDFALSSTIIKKWQASTQENPAAKMFLEAHQAMKRLIVTWTGQMHLGSNEEWPITEELVQEKLLSHEVNTVLDAIKTMVVTFDLMTEKERTNLDTDREIQLNAKWVGYLADYCLGERQKRLGAVANRVR